MYIHKEDRETERKRKRERERGEWRGDTHKNEKGG